MPVVCQICWSRKSGNFFGESVDLAPCARDFVHVFFVAKKRGLRNPDGFESGAVRLRIDRFEKGVGLGGLRAAEALAIFAILKNMQSVNRWIAGLIWNAFRIHDLNQFFGRGASELF